MQSAQSNHSENRAKPEIPVFQYAVVHVSNPADFEPDTRGGETIGQLKERLKREQGL